MWGWIQCCLGRGVEPQSWKARGIQVSEIKTSLSFAMFCLESKTSARLVYGFCNFASSIPYSSVKLPNSKPPKQSGSQLLGCIKSQSITTPQCRRQQCPGDNQWHRQAAYNKSAKTSNQLMAKSSSRSPWRPSRWFCKRLHDDSTSQFMHRTKKTTTATWHKSPTQKRTTRCSSTVTLHCCFS
jgi:hypothetical protein